VRRIVFDARYLVLGLGDVYLGAPVATRSTRATDCHDQIQPGAHLDPRNAVGIGGAYLCVYGMEGPAVISSSGARSDGNRYHRTAEFLRRQALAPAFFRSAAFYPVEPKSSRSCVPTSLWQPRLRIEPAIFALREYRRFLDEKHLD